MAVQSDLCRTCSETTLLVFPRGGSYTCMSVRKTVKPYYHASLNYLYFGQSLSLLLQTIEFKPSLCLLLIQGLKKPYNPIIGETFRCYWNHPSTNSRTFYIAEQLSHHPPVTGFYVTNRKDGFNISASILAKSKFYGKLERDYGTQNLIDF